MKPHLPFLFFLLGASLVFAIPSPRSIDFNFSNNNNKQVGRAANSGGGSITLSWTVTYLRAGQEAAAATSASVVAKLGNKAKVGSNPILPRRPPVPNITPTYLYGSEEYPVPAVASESVLISSQAPEWSAVPSAAQSAWALGTTPPPSLPGGYDFGIDVSTPVSPTSTSDGLPGLSVASIVSLQRSLLTSTSTSTVTVTAAAACSDMAQMAAAEGGSIAQETGVPPPGMYRGVPVWDWKNNSTAT